MLRDNPSGYIVLAINFITSEKATFKIGVCRFGNPDPDEMRAAVMRESGELQFLGTRLEDPPETKPCWFSVPVQGYTIASWRYYTVEDLRRRTAALANNAAKMHFDGRGFRT